MGAQSCQSYVISFFFWADDDGPEEWEDPDVEAEDETVAAEAPDAGESLSKFVEKDPEAVSESQPTTQESTRSLYTLIRTRLFTRP